jgi:hypothetical protein
MIDHQIYRNERFDDFRIGSDALNCAAHGGQVDHERNTCEILQNDARNHERDFFVSRFRGVPVRESFYIASADFLSVAIAQHRLKDDANADRQPRDFRKALFGQDWQRMEVCVSSTDLKFSEGFELVRLIHRSIALLHRSELCFYLLEIRKGASIVVAFGILNDPVRIDRENGALGHSAHAEIHLRQE